VAVTTELLEQSLLVKVASTGHVRTADGGKVDDHATAWQKSEQRSGRVRNRSGGSGVQTRALTFQGPPHRPTRTQSLARIIGPRPSVDCEGQNDSDPGGRLQVLPGALALGAWAPGRLGAAPLMFSMRSSVPPRARGSRNFPR